MDGGSEVSECLGVGGSLFPFERRIVYEGGLLGGVVPIDLEQICG